MRSTWARTIYVLALLAAVTLLWVEVDHSTAGLVAIVGTLLGLAVFWYAERRGVLRSGLSAGRASLRSSKG
jgi:hypothetical protein